MSRCIKVTRQQERFVLIFRAITALPCHMAEVTLHLQHLIFSYNQKKWSTSMTPYKPLRSISSATFVECEQGQKKQASNEAINKILIDVVLIQSQVKLRKIALQRACKGDSIYCTSTPRRGQAVLPCQS